MRTMRSPTLSQTEPATTERTPRSRTPRRAYAGAGAAALAVVLVGLLVANLITTDRSETGGTKAQAVAKPAEVLAAVDAVRTFVERERGLKFAPPLRVRVLAEGDFDRFTAKVADARAKHGRANAEKTQALLLALGLLPAGADLPGELRALEESTGGVARYDITGHTLAVRAVAATPYVRFQLARELTYALLDQHFGLDRPHLAEARDGSGFAFTALVAGDVARIAGTYRSSLPDREQAQVTAEEGRMAKRIAERQIPPVVSRFAALPNQAGPALVGAIFTHGGQRALDKAFSDPPVTAAQVLSPDRYLARRAAVRVPAPAAYGRVFDAGQFGVDHLLYLLGDSPTAYAAIQGWGGDHYVVRRDGDRSCVRVAFVGGTPRGTHNLADALDLWAATRPAAALVTRSRDQVVLSSCGAPS